jgi:hypothetical protein
LARWDASDCDVVSRTKAALTAVRPPAPAQARGLEARCGPQSGKQPSGLDRCWHGRHGRRAQGLALSTLAGRDLTDHGASGRRVAPTPPPDQTSDAEATRSDVSLAPWGRVGAAPPRRPLRDVIPDGSDSPQTCTRGGRALGLAPMGPRRLAAPRRSLSQGPSRPGAGRPQPSDGQGPWGTRARLAQVATAEDASGLSPPGRHPVPCPCHCRVGLVGDTTHHRRAGLVSPDLHGAALPRSRSDQARCQSAWRCRDATPSTGLTAGPARSPAQRNWPCHASVRAVTLAKRAARPHHGEAASAFALARLQRRACPHHLIERLAPPFAQGHSWEQSSPAYAQLCNYGTSTAMAA